MMRPITLFAALAALAVPTWAAPAHAQQTSPGRPIDGIRCDTMEGSVLHIHQHLAIRDHGKPITVPDDVGRPIVAQCLYWIHTHTPDGIIHIEAPNFRSFTLGNFFDVWGEPLTKTGAAGAKLKKNERLAVWVDGNRYSGDPRAIPLTQHLDVTIEVGPPYTKPAPFTEWNGN